MGKLRVNAKNLRKAGDIRVKHEMAFIEPYDFWTQDPRAVAIHTPGGMRSLTRDYFPRQIPLTKGRGAAKVQVQDKRGNPKWTYESGIDTISVHRTRGTVALSQVTITPFVKLKRDETGTAKSKLAWRQLEGSSARQAITWDLHAGHGEPPFPGWENTPLIPDTIEARDAEAARAKLIEKEMAAGASREQAEELHPTRVFHVEDWFRSPDLQRRFPTVAYLVSYGHLRPVRIWWLPGKRFFTSSVPPDWFNVQAYVGVEAAIKAAFDAEKEGKAKLLAKKVAPMPPDLRTSSSAEDLIAPGVVPPP